MISRFLNGMVSRSRAWILRQRGACLRGKVWLRDIEVPRQHHRIILDADVALDRGVTLLVSGEATAPPAIEIGARVYVNRHTIFDASESIRIGADCMIGPFCYFTDHDHTFGDDGLPGSGALIAAPVVLEPGCWIGAHVSILKGVTIGRGAVVGAGAVVTRDVPAGGVAVGNPARLIQRSA